MLDTDCSENCLTYFVILWYYITLLITIFIYHYTLGTYFEIFVRIKEVIMAVRYIGVMSISEIDTFITLIFTASTF
jgi:hypothetical protein